MAETSSDVPTMEELMWGAVRPKRHSGGDGQPAPIHIQYGTNAADVKECSAVGYGSGGGGTHPTPCVTQPHPAKAVRLTVAQMQRCNLGLDL